MTDMQVANTILAQLGGTGKLTAMIGARQFVAIENGVQFSFQGCRIANKARITLSALDLYDLELFKYQRRSGDCPRIMAECHLCADGLREAFASLTGLDLDL